MNPSHQRCPILPSSQFPFEFVQEPLFAVIANRVDIDLIHSRCPFVGLHPLPGFSQGCPADNLIVEKCVDQPVLNIVSVWRTALRLTGEIEDVGLMSGLNGAGEGFPVVR